jgi:hypothetical protein
MTYMAASQLTQVQAGPINLIEDDSPSEVDERVDSTLPGVAKVGLLILP